MENWHPVLLVVLIALIPTVSGVAVFFLMLYRIPPVIFFPGVAAIILVLQSYFYEMYKNFKQRKLWKLTALAVVLALIFIVPYSAYAILTPSWSFKVSTDKTVYRLGENVTITATLTNNGLITHSFSTAKYSISFLFTVQSLLSESNGNGPQWWSFVPLNHSELSLGPGQSIEPSVVWNQTQSLSLGVYEVSVEVGNVSNFVVIFQQSVLVTIEQ